MVTCGNCGRHVDRDFPFCPYCRAELIPAPSTREQRKRVTILFCDITGSTALGESTDPEALRALLARYFSQMKGIIESHGGTVEKFIGDAVMAVFGVPVLHEDDALRSARAAMEMQAALPRLGIRARIGINSGEVVTGTIERLATGDAVNVAARLEQAATPGEVLIGEETLRLVRDTVEIEAVDPLELKGKRSRVPAYRLIDVKQGGERRQLKTPMIGRERELDRLQDAFAQAVDDRSCQLFTILGAAGVGKSRLSMEFLKGLDGARVVRGRCLSYGEGITYWPVIEALTQISALPSDASAASALESLLGGSEVASAEEIAWAFRKLLEEQAQEQPLVVIFDDIHWGEATFLDLVEHLADLSRDAAILLLCMARPELLEKQPSWGGGKWNATTVLLEPLSAAQTDRLLDALGGVAEELRERIGETAEGNPLFVEEMVALINESGEREVVVPPTIQALLAARLDQLEPSERSVLECGAVEGPIFHRSAIMALLEEQTNLPGKLMALVRKELVRPARGQLSGDEAYRFRHLLIRDAAYDALTKTVRAELHERFGEWLEARGAELVELDEILGYHLEQAARYQLELGQPDAELAEQAGERIAAAGRRALWRGDTRAARGLLERALTLLRPIRLDVDLELDLARLQPTLQEAAAVAQVVADRARAANDRRGESTARVVAAHYRLQLGTGSVDELEARAREALPLLEESDDHAGLVRVWRAFGRAAQLRGRFEKGTQAIEQAISHARRIGQPGLFGLSFALFVGPRPADEVLRSLDSLLPDEPHPFPRLDRAVVLAMLGRFEEAQVAYDEASARLNELTGEPGPLADIATLAGDHERAAHLWRVCCDWAEQRGDQSQLAWIVLLLGRSLCMLGQYDEAEPLAQRGRELGDEQEVLTQTLWRQVQALVLASRGQHDEAERLAREAVEIAERTDGLRWQGDALCDLAQVLERAGRVKEATAALEQALDRYERKRNLAMVTRLRQRLGASEESVSPA
ncbi:MAG TPA: adenylate/guanylate cyclase domain-containing protein [Chloroflexota bacterium]